MARKLRLEYAGAIYHVMSRGNRREAIFKDDEDRQGFVTALAEACVKTGWQVHAACLMPNHFHLVVETPRGNLVAGMKWLLGTYTGRFNRRHRLAGHLFSGRYKSLIVDGSGNGYLRTVCDYVHLNPARAKLLEPAEPLRAYRWSTWPDYLKAPGERPAWLRVDRVLGEHGIPKDSPAGRRALEVDLERRRGVVREDEWKAIRRGWCCGGEEFQRELLAQMGDKMGGHHYGAERLASATEQAEQIVRTELKRAGWSEAELPRRRKADPLKLLVAARLRQETTMTLKWIAGRLAMGTWKYLNGRLHARREELKSKSKCLNSRN